MSDFSFYLIIALLPLSALMLVCQVNPYHALIIRGVLGAIAALVDALLGAADVALTEALVGTMLSITLYAVAVRSSLVMRLGLLTEAQEKLKQDASFQALINQFQTIINQYYLRLEIIYYPDQESLKEAFFGKEIHTTCLSSHPDQYHTETRLKRLYDILESQLDSSTLALVELEQNLNLAKEAVSQ